jgi:hypothetical protein
MKVIIDGRFVLDEADLHRRLAKAFGQVAADDEGRDGAERFVFRLFE